MDEYFEPNFQFQVFPVLKQKENMSENYNNNEFKVQLLNLSKRVYMSIVIGLNNIRTVLHRF